MILLIKLCIDIKNKKRIEEYPISGKNNELIYLCKAMVINIWDRNQTKILQTKVPKGSSHGQTRGITIRQPYTCNLGLVLQREDSSLALLDPRSFP